MSISIWEGNFLILQSHSAHYVFFSFISLSSSSSSAYTVNILMRKNDVHGLSEHYEWNFLSESNLFYFLTQLLKNIIFFLCICSQHNLGFTSWHYKSFYCMPYHGCEKSNLCVCVVRALLISSIISTRYHMLI